MQTQAWDVEVAAARYRSGEPAKWIARDYGLAPQTVEKRLRKHGVEWRGRQRTVVAGQAQSARTRRPIDEQRLRKLAAGGSNCAEIGRELNCSEETARRWLIRLGIPRLPAKARMEHNAFWAGGRTQDKSGYWLVKAPDHPQATQAGYVREHRLLMEQKLGRYLTREEVIDHIDGDTSNNDPANLRLFPNNAEHLRVTLKGRVPRWSEDGRRRMRAGHLGPGVPHGATRQESGSGAAPSQ